MTLKTPSWRRRTTGGGHSTLQAKCAKHRILTLRFNGSSPRIEAAYVCLEKRYRQFRNSIFSLFFSPGGTKTGPIFNHKTQWNQPGGTEMECFLGITVWKWDVSFQTVIPRILLTMSWDRVTATFLVNAPTLCDTKFIRFSAPTNSMHPIESTRSTQAHIVEHISLRNMIPQIEQNSTKHVNEQ